MTNTPAQPAWFFSAQASWHLLQHIDSVMTLCQDGREHHLGLYEGANGDIQEDLVFLRHIIDTM